MKYIRTLEAARGAAALLVAFAHIGNIMLQSKYGQQQAWMGFFRFGHAGVDFFFVLSGFIIAHVHWDDIGRPQRLRRYAWRRFARIFPLWWIVFAAALLTFLLNPALGQGFETQTADILTSFGLIPWTNPPIVPVAWSLSHELLFYLVFGLAILRPWLGVLAFASWQASVLIWGIGSDMPAYPWRFLTHSYNVEFLLGIAVALLVRSGRTAQRPGLWLAAGLTLFVAPGLAENHGLLPMTPPELFRYTTLCYAPGAAIILFGLIGLDDKIRVPRWMMALGAASYAIYLTHVLAVSAGIKLAVLTGMTVFWPLTWSFLVLVTCAVGIATHRLIEIPILHRLRGKPDAKVPLKT